MDALHGIISPSEINRKDTRDIQKIIHRLDITQTQAHHKGACVLLYLSQRPGDRRYTSRPASPGPLI